MAQVSYGARISPKFTIKSKRYSKRWHHQWSSIAKSQGRRGDELAIFWHHKTAARIVSKFHPDDPRHQAFGEATSNPLTKEDQEVDTTEIAQEATDTKGDVEEKRDPIKMVPHVGTTTVTSTKIIAAWAHEHNRANSKCKATAITEEDIGTKIPDHGDGLHVPHHDVEVVQRHDHSLHNPTLSLHGEARSTLRRSPLACSSGARQRVHPSNRCKRCGKSPIATASFKVSPPPLSFKGSSDLRLHDETTDSSGTTRPQRRFSPY